MEHQRPVEAGRSAVQAEFVRLRLALQNSEELRTLLFFLVLCLAFVLTFIRHLAGGSFLGAASIVICALFGLFCIYAAGLLLLVRRFNRRRRTLPEWVWAGSTLAESLFPTLVIFVMQKLLPTEPLAALSAPTVMLYGLFIVLSVLRLRPWLCLASGIVAGASYAALTTWVLSSHDLPQARVAAAIYIGYSVIIGMMGVAAFLVSRAVRNYVVAAVREAETRRELARVQRDLEIARKIQQTLLPAAMPVVARYELAGWNRSAEQTGGDYYDWQALPDGRLALVIADVTGHGIGPAILMSMCRAYARSILPEARSLPEALARLNRSLAQDVSEGRFVTLALAVLTPQTDQLEFLSAGHGPLLYYCPAKARVARFSGDGLPLGIVPDAEYGPTQRLHVQPGDVFFMLTDGFLEAARPDGTDYGVERVEQFLVAHAQQEDLHGLVEKLAGDVTRFVAGRPQADDMTAVVLRRGLTSA